MSEEVRQLMARQPLNNVGSRGVPARGELPGEKTSGVEVFDEVDGQGNLVGEDNPFKATAPHAPASRP